ncbi:hypothetical protein Vretifemale_12404, partial [Volvox reticuliferus]
MVILFFCVTGKEQKQQDHSYGPEWTSLSRGSNNCSTFPTSTPKPSDIRIKHTSQLELAMRYGRSHDAVLVLACSRIPSDTNTNAKLCELEPVYCNLSAVKTFGISVSALSDRDTYEVATDVFNVIMKTEPALLQDAREHLRRLVTSDIPENLTLNFSSGNYPQVSRPQTLPTLLTGHAQGTAVVRSSPDFAPAQVAVSIPRPWEHVVLESVMYESSCISAGNANNVIRTTFQPPSSTKNGNTQRQIVQRRWSLLSRVTVGQTSTGKNNCPIKSFKYQASDSTTTQGRTFIPAVILHFQLRLQRPSQPHYSHSQPFHIARPQPATSGGFWPS